MLMMDFLWIACSEFMEISTYSQRMSKDPDFTRTMMDEINRQSYDEWYCEMTQELREVNEHTSDDIEIQRLNSQVTYAILDEDTSPTIKNLKEILEAKKPDKHGLQLEAERQGSTSEGNKEVSAKWCSSCGLYCRCQNMQTRQTTRSFLTNHPDARPDADLLYANVMNPTPQEDKTSSEIPGKPITEWVSNPSYL